MNIYYYGVSGPHARQEAQHVIIPAGTIHHSPLHLDSHSGGGGGVGKETLAGGVVSNCRSVEECEQLLADNDPPS